MYERAAIRLVRDLGKVGIVGVGVVASIYATVTTVRACNCNKGIFEEDDLRINVPGFDYPPFRRWNYNWDGMEPGENGAIWPSGQQFTNGTSNGILCEDSATSPIVSKVRRHLILVRHGQYTIDPNEDDSKQRLTSLGEEQAAMVGKRLAKMNVKFKSIVSSSMTRAVQTANIILKNLDQKDICLVKDSLLNEGPPCVPEPPYRKPELWNPNHRDVLVEGARIEAGFRKYFHRAEAAQEEDSWELIVCHGNVIRYFTCRSLQFPPEGWIRISIEHCSVTRLTILPSGEVILRALGDCGHIPTEKVSVV